MPTPLTMDDVLNAIDSPQVEEEKTASESQNNKVDAESLKTEIENMLNGGNEDEEKVASDGTGDDLEKVAMDVIASQNDALHQDAFMMGAAIRDGFEARGAFYGDAIEKTAQAEGQSIYEALTKFAQENPELLKEAIAEGYRDAFMEKRSQVEEQLEKNAFWRGHHDTIAVLNAMSTEEAE